MKTKENATPVATSDQYYDLFEGGYIKPDELVEADDAEKVKAAMQTIREFFSALEDADLLEEI